MNEYARCPTCGEVMHPGSGCVAGERDVVRWGAESELAMRAQLAHSRGVADPFAQPVALDDPELDAFLRALRIGPYVDAPCPDCNCAIGAVHHEGCDREECATCHRQRLTCACP